MSLRLACNSRYFVFSLVSLLSFYGSGVINVKFCSESSQSDMPGLGVNYFDSLVWHVNWVTIVSTFKFRLLSLSQVSDLL